MLFRDKRPAIDEMLMKLLTPRRHLINYQWEMNVRYEFGLFSQTVKRKYENQLMNVTHQ